jgi:hypothetical protein
MNKIAIHGRPGRIHISWQFGPIGANRWLICQQACDQENRGWFAQNALPLGRIGGDLRMMSLAGFINLRQINR